MPVGFFTIRFLLSFFTQAIKEEGRIDGLRLEGGEAMRELVKTGKTRTGNQYDSWMDFFLVFIRFVRRQKCEIENELFRFRKENVSHTTLTIAGQKYRSVYLPPLVRLPLAQATSQNIIKQRERTYIAIYKEPLVGEISVGNRYMLSVAMVTNMK